ncbi:cell surface glycoprotein 1 [Ceratobasidium sp. AG-Ba]|nr:cell surface glycoprotein 1 [Ceratobasidium sp. AG-Ba]
MEYAASKASSETPAIASSASSTHSANAKPNGEPTPTIHNTPLPTDTSKDATPVTSTEIHADATKSNTPSVKGDSSSVKGEVPSGNRPAHDPDDDPRAQLIETLRSQLTDVHTQLSQLNSKLVQSYDRVSHLEDTLEVANSTLQKTNARVAQLEASQAEHEAALESGLLVEREHVAHELSQLMERATKEAAQRGEADAARSKIETELDDLSADLFGRANTMVAEARIARAASERRVVEAENALKGAEVAVKGMQTQMQSMAEARRAAEAQLAEMRAKMEKGKWVDRGESGFEVNGPKRRLYNSHNVYREFTAFVLHLRGLRAAGNVLPQMAALVSLPFIARLIAEDCDPTLRLDLAPALNWLTRRAVHGAILQGQLEIEPVYGLLESECALCGLTPHGLSTPSGSAATSPTTTTHTLSPKTQSSGGVSMAAWASSTSKYLKGSLGSPTASPHTNHTQVHPVPPQIQRQITDPNAPPVYIFRVAGAQNTAGAAPMALCTGGWCLARLRATCELCSFIKHGVVEKVWSEAPMISAVPPPTSTNQYIQSVVSVLGRDKDKDKEKDKEVKEKDAEAPSAPPRRRQLSSLGSSLWEKGLGAFGGSRNASRSGTPAPEEAKELSPNIPHRVPPPLDAKPAATPPPPPPRSRPVPPVPAPIDPESKPAPEEHHEEIHHAMVFDAADSEHGHHAVSPATDKRHSIPPPIPGPANNPTESPRPEPVALPPVEEADLTAEKPAPAAVTDDASAPAEAIPVAKSEPEPAAAPETPRRPPPIARPPRRLIPNEDKPPMSPRTVTLPDSRPGTPVPDERPSTPPNPSARAMSPTPGSSPLKRTGSLRRDAESGRASSPAPGDGGPPKIPRRAPRRAAPVPPGTPSAPSAAPEPAKAEEKETKPEEKADEKEEKHDAEEKPAAPRPPPRRVVPPPPAPPLPDRARAPQPTEQSNVSEEATRDGGDGSKPVEDIKADEAKPNEPPTENASSPAPPVTTMVTSATNDSLAKSEPAIIAAPSTMKESSNLNGKNPDDGRFVGEETWEERAYKEIIKLREDMFWARIGSAW